MRDAIEKRRKCELCNIEVHRASYQKHLSSKMHSSNEMIIPNYFFNETSVTPQKITKKYNRKPLKELSRNKIKIDDKQLHKELA